MRRLLTFVYGLLMFGLALLGYYCFKTTDEWYRWIYAITSILICFDAFRKLDKSIEQ